MNIPSFMATQDVEAAVVDGNGTETGHIIVTTIGGKNGQPKQVSVWLTGILYLFITFEHSSFQN